MQRWAKHRQRGEGRCREGEGKPETGKGLHTQAGHSEGPSQPGDMDGASGWRHGGSDPRQYSPEGARDLGWATPVFLTSSVTWRAFPIPPIFPGSQTGRHTGCYVIGLDSRDGPLPRPRQVLLGHAPPLDLGFCHVIGSPPPFTPTLLLLPHPEDQASPAPSATSPPPSLLLLRRPPHSCCS